MKFNMQLQKHYIAVFLVGDMWGLESVLFAETWSHTCDILEFLKTKGLDSLHELPSAVSWDSLGKAQILVS